MTMKTRPPRHLSNESRAWFASVVKDYDLESHHLLILKGACESWDRAEQARKLLAEQGLTFIDRHGHIRPNPATTIERDQRGLFARLVRELGLDVEAPAEVRPPVIAGRASRGA